MPSSDAGRFQRRLVEWQARRGTRHVVVGVTIVSVLASVIITYPAMILGYGSVQATGVVGMVLPIAVPAIVAPVATQQIVKLLREANVLVTELVATRQQLHDEIARRAVIQGELESLSRHDPLTGVLNRRGFYDAMDRDPELGRTPFTVTVADVDDFKSVNDAHGHAAGDDVLVEVANRLSGLGDEPIVARLGGDEFVVVRPDDLAERELRDADSRVVTIEVDGVRVDVSFSVGSAVHEASGAIDRTILRADRTMYAAKKNGRRQATSPARGRIRTAGETPEVVSTRP